MQASEFTSAMPVNEVTAVGPMMISEVPAWTWEEMSEAERTTKVQEMGRLAEQKGFVGVFLMDDTTRKSWPPGASAPGRGCFAPKKPASGE